MLLDVTSGILEPNAFPTNFDQFRQVEHLITDVNNMRAELQGDEFDA